MKVIAKHTKALYCFNDYYIAYKKGSLFINYFDKKKSIFLCRMPMPILKRLFTKNRYFERAIHLDPRACSTVDDSTVVLGIGGHIYRIDIKSGTVICEHHLIDGMNAPLSFFKIKDIDGFDDSVIYGEYTNEIKEHTVSIYQRELSVNSKWEKVFTFEKGAIQHIHGFISHPMYKDSLFVMTGDRDNESGFWILKNGYKECIPVISGKQKYRACVAYPYKNGFIYATDNPFDKNEVIYLDLEEKSIKTICEIEGTVINGIDLGDIGYFSTTVESVPFTKTWQVVLPQPLASGVKDKYVNIYKVNKLSGEVTKLQSFVKDCLYMPLFQFGNVGFCPTDNKRLLINPTAVKKFDNTVIEIK